MRHVAAAIALLTLAACGGAVTNQATNAGTANLLAQAPAAPPPDSAAPPPAASAGAGGVDAAFLVGRWSEDGDCTASIEFRSDGSFTFPWGDTSRWTLAGDRLTMTGNGGDLHVAADGHDRMNITYPNGSVHRSTRC
jgi:hypothetical protein